MLARLEGGRLAVLLVSFQRWLAGAVALITGRRFGEGST